MKNGNIAPSKIHQRILFNDGISDANSPSESGPVFFHQAVFVEKSPADSLALCPTSWALSSAFLFWDLKAYRRLLVGFCRILIFYISHGPLDRLEAFGKHKQHNLLFISTFKFNFNSRHLLPSDNTAHSFRLQGNTDLPSSLTPHRRLVSSTPSLRLYK